jgi:ribosomal protein L16 Arg81 hydroxylase
VNTAGGVREGVTVESTLAWLLHPLTVKTFFDQIWGVTDYHVAGRRQDYFDRLVQPLSAADDLLECVRPTPSAVRLVRGDEIKKSDGYLRGDGSLDLAAVRDDFNDGYTIVLDGLEHHARAVASLSHSLEVELNFPTQANGYLTPPQSTGFTPHYDHHDVLILQVAGAKTWHLYDDAAVSPQRMQRREKPVAADLPAPADVHLAAGDVLYLPSGRIHAAETGSESSVHLTVGVHTPTVLTLLTHALHLLSFNDGRVHTRLPPRHLDDADVRSGLSGLVGEIVETLEAPDAIDEALGAMADLLVRRGRCPPVGQASAAVDIDARTPVVKHQPLYSRVLPVGERVGLQFAQLLISADSDHETAMLFLSASSEPFRVGDLPGLDGAQQIQLARTLLTSGFLSRLPDS